MQHKLLRLNEVMELTGFCRSTIYKWMSKGDFPPNKQLGARSVAWLESDIIEWIDAKQVYKPKPLVFLVPNSSSKNKK